ncbi:MAG: hypothetical protein J7647_22975 [Cyanobacteria bacterium SBLK]|nr:hypothetical protein [Cyanobacteria bacterium SBLK]
MLISILLWSLWAIYIGLLLLSPSGWLVPGDPIWAIQPETVREVMNESIDFFFISSLLAAISPFDLQVPWVHPVSEALFNFALAWMFAFLPLLLADRQGEGLPKRIIWIAAMFLTNVFLLPYMALRKDPTELEHPPFEKKPWRSLGWISLFVGTVAIVWGVFVHPEAGNLAARVQYFGESFGRDRVTVAFCVDLLLFWMFQIILLRSTNFGDRSRRWLHYLPFLGLIHWLVFA